MIERPSNEVIPFVRCLFREDGLFGGEMKHLYELRQIGGQQKKGQNASAEPYCNFKSYPLYASRPILSYKHESLLQLRKYATSMPIEQQWYQ